MENITKARLENLLKARGVEVPSEDKKLITEAVGYIKAEDKFMERDDFDWHIPGGYVTQDAEEAEEQEEQEQEPVNVTQSEVETHKGERVVEGVNDQYDLDKDNDIDDDDKNLAASEIVVEEEAEYEYIHDEETWNASFENGALKDYYANNPDEDRWNVTENRACNFNDKIYKIYGYDNVL